MFYRCREIPLCRITLNINHYFNLAKQSFNRDKESDQVPIQIVLSSACQVSSISVRLYKTILPGHYHTPLLFFLFSVSSLVKVSFVPKVFSFSLPSPPSLEEGISKQMLYKGIYPVKVL